MSKVLINDSHLHAIADAIREKNGKTDTYKPREMANAIRTIPTGGGNVLVSLTATENGNYTPDDGVDGYSAVTVNVNIGYRPLPHYARLTNGYVGGGTFYFVNASSYPSDMYRVQAGHSYVFFSGTHYGSRWRLMFTTEDVSQYPISHGDVNGKYIEERDGQSGPMATAYKPSQDGYVLLSPYGGAQPIYSYAFDISGFDGMTIED